jgi:signal transduction histidine kinase
VTTKLTNPLHGLYFTPRVASYPFRHFAPETGVIYWAVTGIAYIGAAIGMYLLFNIYSSSKFNTTKLTALTVLIGLPVVPKVLAVLWPNSLLFLYYEPLGAAVFGIGIVTAAKDSFLSVRAPARRQLADRLSELIIVLDNRDRVADFNHNAKQTFDELEQSLGDPLEAAVPVLSEFETDASLLEIQHDTGSRYYTVQAPTIRSGGNAIGQAIVLSDVTEVEVQRNRLEQHTEHIEGVTEEIAHQLRNPLTILKGELNALDDDTGSKARSDGGTSNDSIGAAMEATERIEQIADDLLAIISSGKPITETEQVALSTLITETFDAIGAENMELELSIGESVATGVERIRCGELFRLLFQVYRQRGATVVTVERAGDQLIFGSDGNSFDIETPEELFEYGVETDEDVRMLLAHARTLTRIHGWSIHAPLDQDTHSLVISGVTFRTNEEH